MNLNNKYKKIMCTMGEHIVLAESENVRISWCKGCKGYSVVYNSCCLTFSKYELIQFKEVLVTLCDSDFHYDFFGKKQVLIKNQFGHMGICLTRKDVRILDNAIQKALTVNEVFEIIYD